MSPASLGVAAIYIASLAAGTLVAVGLGGADPPPVPVLAAALMPVAVPRLLEDRERSRAGAAARPARQPGEAGTLQ